MCSAHQQSSCWCVNQGRRAQSWLLRYTPSHNDKKMKELQQAQGCQGRAAAARSGVRRSRGCLAC